MTVSDITRAKYERVIQRHEDKGIWVYICKRNDGRVALVIPYHHESGVLAPPMMHRACDPGQADTDDPCVFLNEPCQADPWAFMNWAEFKQTHERKIEPPPAFWDLMMEAVELRRVPEESNHEAV